MDEFYNLTISLHVGIIYIALIMAGINFYILRGENPKRKYLAILPLYYMVLASLAFTGLVMINFITNILPIALMSIAFIYILVTTIKTYKRTKIEPKLTQTTISSMQKKYLVDMVIYVLFIIYGRF